MKTDRIFIGNIKRCIKYERKNVMSNSTYIDNELIDNVSFGYIDFESELYKENAILVEFQNGVYVDIENLNTLLDYIRVYGRFTGNGGYRPGGLLISTKPYFLNNLFVDKDSLKPYYDKEEKIDNISLKTLKKNLKK